MNLVLLEDGSALCNDGSPPGYYINSQNSSKWVISLEGGGWCFDDFSCGERWNQSPSLMSSNYWPKTMQGSGLLSSNVSQNGNYYDRNLVLIKYCSSDSFSGDFDGKWHFHGFRIVPNIINDLIYNYGAGDATDVLFTGASAGAEGLFAHADTIAMLFPKANFMTFVDSGWFMDFAPFSPQPCHDINDCTEQGGLERGSSYWNSQGDPDCLQDKNSSSKWECLLGYRAYPYVSNPLFIFVYQFDLAQLGHDAIHNLPSGAQLEYAQEAAVNLTRTLKEVDTYFSPSCYAHTIEYSNNWNQLAINDVLLMDAVAKWEQSGTPVTYFDTCNTPNCNPTCL